MSSDKKTKIKPVNLPKKILPIECKDKVGWCESWFEGRDLMDPIHPYRISICGIPSSGKSNFSKNLIIKASKSFEKILVVVFNKNSTEEWNEIGADVVETIPDPKLITDRKLKKLIVIDDVELSLMSKQEKYNLSRLFCHISSHNNTSIIITSQCVFNIPTIARRCSNIIVIFRCPDLNAVSTMARRFGLSSAQLLDIFQKYMTTPHSCLVLDSTFGTPAPIRMNGYQILHKGQDGLFHLTDKENEE